MSPRTTSVGFTTRYSSCSRRCFIGSGILILILATVFSSCCSVVVAVEGEAEENDGSPDHVYPLEWQHWSDDDNDADTAGASLPRKSYTIAFGSCHSRKKFRKNPPRENVWQVISRTASPQMFVWTGDVVYPSHGDKNVSRALEKEYISLVKEEHDMGYTSFAAASTPVIHGVWDDHDYGTNDAGSEIPLAQRMERRSVYWQYVLPHLRHSNKLEKRQGMYYSIQIGNPDDVRMILLDTRWSRDYHCLASLSSSLWFRRFVPSFLAALLSAMTRWWTAAWNLPEMGLCHGGKRHGRRRVLSEEQWHWLEQQLRACRNAKVLILVSSIQVLTTNPAVESWGHFAEERLRLLALLQQQQQQQQRILIWSGDVHHAEMLPLNHHIMEITSSGLTHSCEESHGWACKAVLETFDLHQRQGYYTGRNFGVLTVTSTAAKEEEEEEGEWSLEVSIHDARNGSVVLSTGPLLSGGVEAPESSPGQEQVVEIPECLDGHLKKWLWRQAKKYGVLCMTTLLVLFFSYRYSKNRQGRPTPT